MELFAKDVVECVNSNFLMPEDEGRFQIFYRYEGGCYLGMGIYNIGIDIVTLNF